MSYAPSKELVDKIKEFEGFSAEPYLDIAGFRTIGYGELMTASDKRTKVTEEEAEQDLLRILGHVVDMLAGIVNLGKLKSSQIDALVSFTYNLGIGAFRNSTLHRLISDYHYAEAAEEFLKWDHASGREIEGLLKRRKWERDTWMKA